MPGVISTFRDGDYSNVVDDHGVWGLDDSNDTPSSLASYLV